MGRWGLLFENRRGGSTDNSEMIEGEAEDEENSTPDGAAARSEGNGNGIFHLLSGSAQVSFILVEILYRIFIGCLLGAYGGEGQGRSVDQVRTTSIIIYL